MAVVEAGLIAGYLAAWAVRKARRIGGRLDDEVDAALDGTLDRLHETVSRRLGPDPPWWNWRPRRTPAAFTEVVLEQLAALLGTELPAVLTESTREAHLLGMLADAARESTARGRRLVLVVDGLDEDRGVTAGPDAHSIAAPLPSRPPAGLRVLVTGRPDPPLPDDVPPWHPLRDPGIVRPLAPSTVAGVIRDEAERGLQRLLASTPADRDILGLVVAAQGGLTQDDLAELTDAGLFAVRRTLHSVHGRAFAARAGRRASGDATATGYVLAHEELQVTAGDVLGASRLNAYRARLAASSGPPVWSGQTRSGRPHERVVGTRRASSPGGCHGPSCRLAHTLPVTDGDPDILLATAADLARQGRPQPAAAVAALVEDLVRKVGENSDYYGLWPSPRCATPADTSRTTSRPTSPRPTAITSTTPAPSPVDVDRELAQLDSTGYRPLRGHRTR